MGSFGLKRSRGRISHAKALAACTGAALLAGGAMAVGAIPTSNGTITGCYSKKTGSLRIVDSGKKCGKKETRLTWNRRASRVTPARRARRCAGPMGPAGPAGSAPPSLTADWGPGPRGSAGSRWSAGPAGREGRQG